MDILYLFCVFKTMYDLLNRLTQTSLTTESPIITSYSYMGSERGNNYTTNKLLSETIDGVTYYYDYDANGNIIEISDSNNTLYTYEYDPMQQLTEVWDYARSKRYRYDYDLAGNITYEIIDTLNSQGVPISNLVNNYQYGDNNWKDKLTSYKGQTITYDEIGNPLQYRDGMTMTWKNGRQLSSLQNGNNSVNYNYDSNSVRVSKNVNNTEYKYVYLNGLLLFESRGQAKFYYSYDANGILYSVKYTLTDASDLLTYYFTHNSRGDIVGIYNGAGELRAHYEYDAWGNVISVTDENNTAITNPNHIGNLNPFRYRGYYLDSETGLYYLMSRYYDPVIHRFINADGYFQSGGDILDANMSAYCRNNPVNYSDSSGNSPKTLSQLQKDLTGEGTFNYNINDITSALQQGYNTNDMFFVSDFGGLLHYNVGWRIADTFGAVISSLELELGAGVGMGLTMDIEEFVDVSFGAGWSLISLMYDYDSGINIGMKTFNEASISLVGWDMFSYGGYEFYNYFTQESSSNYGESHIIGISAEAYVGVGGQVSIGWNLDYIANKWNTIWS